MLWLLVWTAMAFTAATLAALTLGRLLLRAVPKWLRREGVGVSVEGRAA
jgi:hypothetical protein